MGRVIFLLGIYAIFFNQAIAGFNNQQLSVMIGSVTSNYKETPSSLQAEDGANQPEAASGSASALPLDIGWEYYSNPKYSYFAHGTVPLYSTTPDRYFFAGGGMNFYFYSISSKASYRDQLVELSFTPIWRYYAGFDLGLGYLIYQTQSQKKSDIVAELGRHAGIIYNIDNKWGAKAEVGYSMGNGVATSTNNLKILLGATFYLLD